MIAPTRSAPKAEQIDRGLPDNIFAGLSFPEVPTTLPTIVRKNDTPQQIGLLDVQTLDTADTVSRETLVPVKVDANPTSLAKLYTSESTVSSTLYPSLPTILPASDGSEIRRSIPLTRDSAIDDSRDEDVHNESASLLGNAHVHAETRPRGSVSSTLQWIKSDLLHSSASKPPQYDQVATGSNPRSLPVQVNAQERVNEIRSQIADNRQRIAGQLNSQTTAISAADDTLVNDLIAENSRLGQEVADLRAALAEQQRQSNLVQSVPMGVAASGQSMSDVGGRFSSGQQPGIELQSRTPGVQVSASPLSQHVQQQTQTQQGREAVKYVSCGNCRQWLVSPMDANYVFCPGCESVNSCALESSQVNVH